MVQELHSFECTPFEWFPECTGATTPLSLRTKMRAFGTLTRATLTQVRKCVGSFGGALVEEFIEGREFTVLVVENAEDAQRPFVLTPVQCMFPEGAWVSWFVGWLVTRPLS